MMEKPDRPMGAWERAGGGPCRGRGPDIGPWLLWGGLLLMVAILLSE